jgi:hypothetical protein
MAGRRDEEEDARGWSAIFSVEKHTIDDAGITEDSGARRKPSALLKKRDPANERTIIDQEMTDEMRRALSGLRKPAAQKQVPLDETTIDPSEAPEDSEDSQDLDYNDATIPSPLPDQTRVDGRIIPDTLPEETEDDDQPPYIDQNFEEPTFDRIDRVDTHGRPPLRSRVNDPPTEALPGSINPDEEAELIRTPHLPSHMLKELGPVVEHRAEEMTVLDVAAALGLSPEKVREETGALPRSASGPKPVPKIIDAPLAEQAEKIREMVNKEEPLAEHPAFRQLKARRLQRGETVFDHLPRWLNVTESAAKLIPVLLGGFLLFMTIGVLVMVFARGGHDTEHVSLRFLPAPGPEEAIDQYAPAPMITLETEPEGILVVLDHKILGATPLTFEMPLRTAKVGVELSSPYFETYIAQTEKSVAGEFRVRARLIRKR